MHTLQTAGATVRGAAHIARGKPCQDALLITGGEGKPFTVAAIADGHGSENCPYSDEGAKAAVQVAAVVITSMLANRTDGEAFAMLGTHKDIWLPKQIETQWKESIRDTHARKERAVDESGPFPYSLYGTTLTVAAVTATFVFALQIGDGDILWIEGNHSGEGALAEPSARWLIPPDYNLAGETLSLCLDQSWQHARVFLRALYEPERPVMLLLSTDGYANSFSAPEGFLKAGEDIYKLWAENGVEYIRAHLENWLNESTADGSGDDITAALIFWGKGAPPFTPLA
jgi:serine/threonine protein phosphatase PrpC